MISKLAACFKLTEENTTVVNQRSPLSNRKCNKLVCLFIVDYIILLQNQMSFVHTCTVSVWYILTH